MTGMIVAITVSHQTNVVWKLQRTVGIGTGLALSVPNDAPKLICTTVPITHAMKMIVVAGDATLGMANVPLGKNVHITTGIPFMAA